MLLPALVLHFDSGRNRNRLADAYRLLVSGIERRMKRRRNIAKARPLIAPLPSDTEVAAFMGKLIERPQLRPSAIAQRQDGDLEARQVIGHILQCLSQWPDYRQDAAYTEAGKLIAIRRSGQRFEIRVAEIARCTRSDS